MSEQLSAPNNHEAGFVSIKTALFLGKVALVGGLFIGLPLAGASYGAASKMPPAMSGEISVTDPAKVSLLETKIEQELCIANATVGVSGALGFEGHPLDQNMKGDIFGVKYNLNLEREHSAEVYRKVRYCLEGMSIPYTYDANVAFGNPERPAITAEVSLSKIIVIVSALHDGRDKYHETSDGLLGYYASELNAKLEQKAVQELIGKELAQGADPQAIIDTILRSVLEGYLDKEAAVRCLQAGSDYDWKNSPIGLLLTSAGIEAIQKDFLGKYRDRAQPSASDINFKIVDDITTNPTAQVINKTKSDKFESALNLMTQPMDNGAPRELNIAGMKIPIKYVISPPKSSAGTCVVTPESKLATLTPGDKGEE